MLRALGEQLTTSMRSYDPVVRVGGDEFIAAFTRTRPAAAAARIEVIRAKLEDASPAGSITVGLAQLAPGDDLERLTARGDQLLYEAKHHRPRG